MSDPLDNAFAAFERSAMRLETLPQYADTEDHADLQRFLAGDFSIGSAATPWSKYVGELVRHGKAVRRLRIVTRPLTAYVRYELLVGYQPGVRAGEQIKVFVDEAREIERLDYWLFDDHHLLALHYSQAGAYEGSTEITDERQVSSVRNTIQALWAQATPLQTFDSSG